MVGVPPHLVAYLLHRVELEESHWAGVRAGNVKAVKKGQAAHDQCV